MDTALGKRLNADELADLGSRLISRYTASKQAMDKEWLPKRKKYRKWASGDYSDRRSREEADIFSKSNVPMEFVTGITDYMIARTCEDIFGSSPFFAAVPQGAADKTLGHQVQKHFGYKLSEAHFPALGRQAIRRGFDLGEGLVKATWRRTVDVSERLAMVLSDGKEAVSDENGDFIEPDDINLRDAELGVSLWAKTEIVPRAGEFANLPEVSPISVLVDADGQPVMTGSGEYWFEGDVQTVLDADGQPVGDFLSKSPIVQQLEGQDFAEMNIEETTVMFEGLDNALVEPEDFVAELNLRHLCESQGTFHRLSLRRSALRSDYGLTPEIEALIGTPDSRPKNAEKQAQAGEGERGCDPMEDDPEYECIESYARIEIKGAMVRCYALTEKQSETIIALDYWANVVPQAMNPIVAIVPCPVPGRWHGRGYHEIYENQSDFLDRTFNAILYRNKFHSNPPGFVREEAFKDGSVVKNFVFAAGKFYHLKGDYTAKQALEFVNFPDMDSRTWQIIELVMQLAQVRSGVSGASAGAMTNLPSNGTATGVQSIMLSGSVLHKLPIECVKSGIEELLNVNAVILYSRQNKDETFTYMEGDATELVTLTAKSVKNLKLNIELLLTRMQERQAIDSAKAAIDAVLGYIQNVPEADKNQLRPLFVQILKALRITGADAMLRDGIPPSPDAKEPQLERFTESMNYKDVPPDIKRQMEVAAGYEPSTQPEPVEAGKSDKPQEQAAALPENASL